MKKPYIVIVTAVGIGIIVVAWAFIGSHSPQLSGLTTVKKVTLDETVSLTGTVKPAQEVDLSFQQQGQIVSVNADVGQSVFAGQVIASLDTSTLNASLLQAEAGLSAENINLQNLQSGQSMTLVSGSNGQSTIQASFNNGRQNLLDKLTGGYDSTDSALATYVDGMFSSPRTNPVFNIVVAQNDGVYSVTATSGVTSQLNSERATIAHEMNQWSQANAAATDDAGIEAAVTIGEQTMTDTQSFLTNLAAIFNYNTTDITTQTIYASYRAQVATARGVIDGALSALRGAVASYTSTQSSTSPSSLALEETLVQSAQAKVSAVKAQINQSVIFAPFSGIITVQNAKVGQIASPGTPVVHLISGGRDEIEGYVSEADIAKLNVGQETTVGLDALPGQQFDASIISIDPGETMTGTVAAYKVTFEFATSSPEIKPGMTANMVILVGHRDSTLSVPTSAIITQNNASFVLVKNSKGQIISEKVTTGITGNGLTEILSGLQEGQEVATFGSHSSF